MKKLAGGEEAAGAVPPVTDVVQIQLTLTIVLVQNRTIDVTIRVTPDRTEIVPSAIHATIRRIFGRIVSDSGFLARRQKVPSVFICGQAA